MYMQMARRRAEKGYVHCTLLWNDICIYIRLRILASPDPERKPVDARALLFNARYPADTCEADFTLLRLPHDCSTLALCLWLNLRIHLYT